MIKKMRLGLLLGITVIVIGGFIGCSADGYLEIQNDTGANVYIYYGTEWDDVDETLEDGDYTTWSYDVSTSIFETDDYLAYFGVFGAYQLGTRYEVIVEPNKTTTVVLEADAGGIVVENNAGPTIYSVYIAKQNETSWGDDLLSDGMATNDSLYFIREPGTYKVKIIDSSSNTEEVSNITVSIGGYKTVTYTDTGLSVSNVSVIDSKIKNEIIISPTK